MDIVVCKHFILVESYNKKNGKRNDFRGETILPIINKSMFIFTPKYWYYQNMFVNNSLVFEKTLDIMEYLQK